MLDADACSIDCGWMLDSLLVVRKRVGLESAFERPASVVISEPFKISVSEVSPSISVIVEVSIPEVSPLAVEVVIKAFSAVDVSVSEVPPVSIDVVVSVTDSVSVSLDI